jgi:hypothetical protein
MFVFSRRAVTMARRGPNRRGPNRFRLNDGRRAVRIARDSGMEPAMIEIVGKDGTTFRVYGDKAQTAQDKNSWDEVLTDDPHKKRPA